MTTLPSNPNSPAGLDRFIHSPAGDLAASGFFLTVALSAFVFLVA